MPLTASILAVGDELVLGQALDTNTRAIADALTEVGVLVAEHATVPDDRAAQAAAIARLAAGRGLLVVTGGLGPTGDDLTRQALADAMGEGLVEDADALAAIEAWYTSRGRAMPPPNRVQALRPASARMLANREGTAPGLAAAVGACRVFCLPGPPGEMRAMLAREVVPFVRSVGGGSPIPTRTLRTVGRGESDIAGLLGGLMERDRPILVGTTAGLGVVTVRIRANDSEAAGLSPPSGGDAGTGAIDAVVAEVRGRLGPIVFSDGPDLPEAVLTRLRSRGETLGTIESCTGGLLGAALTAVPGSSDAYAGGLITYTNRLKHNLADVPEEVLATAGAVSVACAAAMADGARRTLGVDHCLAITGVAGPGGGSAAKPVGTVCIALSSRSPPPGSGSEPRPTDARRFLFRGSRDAIRRWSVTSALAMLRLRLDGIETPLLNEQT
jgi:nicotinamide-nucleotide amidase